MEVITGAFRGLGRALARPFLAQSPDQLRQTSRVKIDGLANHPIQQEF